LSSWAPWLAQPLAEQFGAERSREPDKKPVGKARLDAVTRACLVAALLVTTAFAQDEQARRQAYLDELETILPHSSEWDRLVESESGELPPDFSQLPSRPHLVSPLGEGDERIDSPSEWPARREALLALFHQWVIGEAPPAPDNVTAEILDEEERWGAKVRRVKLTFGPGNRAYMNLELYLPAGGGPFPVFLTQDNHRQWAAIALRRGYACVVYAGSDSMDDTESFIDVYPDYEWSKLVRRAWAASRCIDYLETVPEVNAEQIVMTGHSRNGKMSIMASAMDERIAAVISSSSGAGGVLPTRYYSEQHNGEGIEIITRRFTDWFHPRWRFFVGREDRLPVDLHELVALSAPRPCLLSIAYNDGVESTWAMQQTYLSVKPVYDFLGETDHLALLWRPNGHETWPTVIERYVDWADYHFGRGGVLPEERLIHPWDWEAWRANATNPIEPASFPVREANVVMQLADGATIDTAEKADERRAEIRDAVQQMLGTAPPGARTGIIEYGERHYGTNPDHIDQLLGRYEPRGDLHCDDIVFGEYVDADVYTPDQWDLDDGEKRRAILWLHPYSQARGYVAAYRRDDNIFRTFTNEGFAVFCYDQIGHGRRIEEVEGFYDRHPDWSLLGKMVRDAQEALDAMEAIPYIDTDNISVVGYGLGSLVALHLAAVDDRPDRYVIAGIPQPFKLDPPGSPTGGIRRWSKVDLLVPQLGLFEGQEERLPYDVGDLLASMAPRVSLVLCPELDRETVHTDVVAAVRNAREAYALTGNASGLQWFVPKTYNHFDYDMQRMLLNWLKGT
jgi:pimeloyl-ACP methyl ester carboxylesterase